MRVLFLSDARRIGGSEVYLREMLPRVKALGLSPEAALPEAEGTLPVRRALEAAGIPVHAYRDLEALPEAVDLVVASAWYKATAASSPATRGSSFSSTTR